MITKILPNPIFEDDNEMININSNVMQKLSKQVLDWCFNYRFLNLLITLLLIGSLPIGIDKILLCKSLVIINFFPHNLYMFCHTNLQRKMIQTKTRMRENATPFPSKRVKAHYGGQKMFTQILFFKLCNFQLHQANIIKKS